MEKKANKANAESLGALYKELNGATLMDRER